MVGTWLLELYLDQLNRSLLEVKGKGEPLPSGPESDGHVQRATQGTEGGSKALPGPDQLTQDLRAFLKRNVDVLDVNVTVSLLAGYGRLDDLMEYATYRKVSNFKLDYVSLTVAAMKHNAQRNALDLSGFSGFISVSKLRGGLLGTLQKPHTHMLPEDDVCQHAQAVLFRLIAMALH